MIDILRGSTSMLGGTGRTTHLAKVLTEGEVESGDGMRRVRRELGQCDLAKRGVDIPPQWYKPPAAKNLLAVRHGQRHGGGGLLPSVLGFRVLGFRV